VAGSGLHEASLLHFPDAPFAYGVGTRRLRVVIRVAAGSITGGRVAYNDRYAWGTDSYAPMDRIAPLWRYARDGELEYWAAELELPRPRFRYRFGLDSADGLRWYGADGLCDSPEPVDAFEYAYLAEGDEPDPPAWARGATFYQIFPDRFARGRAHLDGRAPAGWDAPPTAGAIFGGDLDGIVAHLDHISALSVDALYLTPIFTAPSEHKYDTSDYFSVDPALGGDAALRRLVAALRERGMRLVLDGVFNHVGNEWPPFQDVLQHGTRSAYARWFFLDAPTAAGGTEAAAEARRGGELGYETWATDVATLPKLRTSEPAVRDLVLRVGRHWIEEFGVAGWRLDVANEVDHRTWRAFRAAVRGVRPDAFLVGEVWQAAMPWLRGDELDSVMNYPLRRSILEYAAGGGGEARGFLDGVDRVRAALPEPVQPFLYDLLGSHDVIRPLDALGGDRAAAAFAAALLFVVPGIASVYYGDEVGMAGGATEHGMRGGMVWDEARQDRALLDLYRRLGRLRRRVGAIRHGGYTRLEEDGPVASFRRTWQDRDVVVVANAGRARASVPARRVDGWLGAPGRVLATYGVEDGRASRRGSDMTIPARSVVLFGRAERQGRGP
jgi:cyclomaltodextrinase / maltogenic alpha-amylase / neopullulanase